MKSDVIRLGDKCHRVLPGTSLVLLEPASACEKPCSQLTACRFFWHAFSRILQYYGYLMSQTTCPVFTPTIDEFENFHRYIASIDEQLEDNGVVKIIPPAGKYIYHLKSVGWFEMDYNWREWNMQVKSPILQLASGRAGVYKVDIVESKSISLGDFEKAANAQGCQEDSYEKVERKFWKSLGIASVGEPPMYGADMVGSLFGDTCTSAWNVSKLDTILKLLGNDLPGITTPMLYVGMWRAMFAFHVEDMDLYSINYLHFGAPKSWYCIPPEYAERFESMANSYFPDLYQQCREYLRHKVVMISPSKLREHGIPFKTVVQQPGEFVITSPKSYHAGYNHGFNLAEATNFATPRWVEFGRRAGVCKCRPFCVSIDMDYFETKYRRLQRKISREEAHGSDDSSTHEGDELVPLDPGWIFRCVCGVRCTEGDPRTKHPVGEQFECSKCGVWCHVQCVFGKDATLEAIPDSAICQVCDIIDTMEEDASADGAIVSEAQRACRSSKIGDGSSKQISTQQKPVYKRARKKRSRPEPPRRSFEVGSEVYVYMFDGSRELGVIERIEEDAAKVRFKARNSQKRKKYHEQWLPLNSNALYLADEVDAVDAVESVESAAGMSGVESNVVPKEEYDNVSSDTSPTCKRVAQTISPASSHSLLDRPAAGVLYPTALSSQAPMYPLQRTQIEGWTGLAPVTHVSNYGALLIPPQIRMKIIQGQFDARMIGAMPHQEFVVPHGQLLIKSQPTLAFPK